MTRHGDDGDSVGAAVPAEPPGPSPRSGPATVPGSTIGWAKRRRGRPRRAMRPLDHRPVLASSSWLVLAIVRSVSVSPLSQSVNRSGSIARWSAASSSGDPACASSWQAVLVGMGWTPVTS